MPNGLNHVVKVPLSLDENGTFAYPEGRFDDTEKTCWEFYVKIY